MKRIVSVKSLLDDYISTHGLGGGARLPPIRDLAEQLSCDKKDLAWALEFSAQSHRLTRDKDGWVVQSRDAIRDHRGFSFAKSAKLRGRALSTDVLEAAQRLPLEDSNHPFHEVELRAQKQLGLAATSPFLVIERVRLLNERPGSEKKRPGALQRAYLDPARFPPDFLRRHKFEKESLIAIYEKRGYKLTTRDTLLTARLVNIYESNVLVQSYKSYPRDTAVLDAEQQLYALDPKTKKPFVLEFLKASYLEDWKYEIKNRPAAAW